MTKRQPMFTYYLILKGAVCLLALFAPTADASVLIPVGFASWAFAGPMFWLESRV